MGMNYANARFQNVEAMVAAMSDSEDQQLTAAGNFLIRTGLGASLPAHGWAPFARGYNAPNYTVNRYDIRLNGEYQKYSAGALQNMNVRAAQLYLTYLGFHPGSIAGIAGDHTMPALAQFATEHGIQHGTSVDSSSVAQLRDALTRALAVAV